MNGGSRPLTPQFVYTKSDWTNVKPGFWLYSGTANVDYVSIKSPRVTKSYDSNSYLVKEDIEDGPLSTYSYSPSQTTVTEYARFLTSPYALTTPNLWYKSSYVTINNNTATLNGKSASLYSNYPFWRQDNPVLKTDFKVTSTSGQFTTTLDGISSSGDTRRLGIIVKNRAIQILRQDNSGPTYPVTLVSKAKANTNYTVEFQTTPNAIKIYLWKSSNARPINTSYTYTVADWASFKPKFSVYSGKATVSNLVIDYAPQTKILSPQPPNTIINSLRKAIEDEPAAQTAYDNAEITLQAAIAIESQKKQLFDEAALDLNSKESALNTIINERLTLEPQIQALKTNIDSLNTQLGQLNVQLDDALRRESEAINRLNQAREEFTSSQTGYDRAKFERESKEAALSNARVYLENKALLKDSAL